MWQRKKDKDVENEEQSSNFTPKYQKPKILLIDLPHDCLDYVQESTGYNVLEGTFGSPYKVDMGDKYQPVIAKASMPNCSEQEIIIIDLTPPTTTDKPQGEKMISEGELDWWAKCSHGEIDPRPRVMLAVHNEFDRILYHGGFFVIFAQPRILQTLVWARIRYRELDTESEIAADNWSFLSFLSPEYFEISADFGHEINVPEDDYQIFHFFRKIINDATYEATFEPSYRLTKNWLPLLKNKFGGCIGGLIVPENSKGRILILPQLSKKSEILSKLLRELIPDISPHLFPHIEGLRWVERDEYELDSIIKYKNEKINVRQRVEKELEELDKKIAEERDEYGFLHGLITQTGQELVLSIKSCLEFIGFKNIVDVDKQICNQNTKKLKQEDLQIHDTSPTLLLEIKGLSSLPREADIIQVTKYVNRRMKEWGKQDVHGVSIINHQRNIPALERDNQHIFTEQQIEDAKNYDITLVSTWDLFLLIRGMMKWKWDPETIQNLFYVNGRISRLPSNYKSIAKIVKYYEQIGVISVLVNENKIYKGQRIGYITSEGYLEEDILSLQLEKQDVEEAIPGQLVGIKTIYSKIQLPEGTIVYKVMKQVI